MNKFFLLSSVSILSLASFNVNATVPAAIAAATASTPQLTSSQLSSIYSALVAQGIKAGLLPSNFNSDISVNYTSTVNTGLVSFTETYGIAPSVITIGSGIYSTAEAQMLIAHAIGMSMIQPTEMNAVKVKTIYGSYGAQTISDINNLETSADRIGAQLIGAQNYINGLSAMEANETSPTDALTLFARAIAIAQANPGVALTIPADIVPGNLFSGQTANVPVTLDYTLVNGVLTLNAAASSAQAVQLVSADATDISNAVNGYTAGGKSYSPNPAVGELNQGGSDLVGLGIAAQSPALTTTLLGNIYGTLVTQGIKAGLLPSNFNNLVSVNYTPTVNTGLVSYTQTYSSGTPAVINIGNNIYSTAEAQMLIAHAIGMSMLQPQEWAALNAAGTYGNYAAQTISDINNLETSADRIGAQLIGAQNYIDGLSQMETSEGSSATDALTLFARAIAIAQANPGTALILPANIIPGSLFSGQTANVPVTLDYTLVNGVPTLNAAASSGQAVQLVSADATDISNAVNGYSVGNKVYSPNPAIGELNQGGSDLVGLGIAALPPSLTAAQIGGLYSAIVAQGISADMLPANFSSLVTTNFTNNGIVGLAAYTAAANGSPAVITTGLGMNSTAEAQMVLANAIGIAQNQGLYNSIAQYLAPEYGINSSQTVSAVNALESAADAYGAKLIGTQAYINGLAALIANENWSAVSVPPNGILPTGEAETPPSKLPDAVSAFLRINQLAEANPGTVFYVPWNVAPVQQSINPYASVPLEYTMVNGVSTLSATPTPGYTYSLSVAAVETSNQYMTGWLNEGQAGAASAEFDSGARNLTGIGLGAAQAPLATSQISTDYSALVAKGISAGILPSGFGSFVSFSSNTAPGLGSYTAATNGVSASIQLGGGITSSPEEQMLLAHEIGVAQSQTLESAAAKVATQYGVNSPQAIAAVNAAESAADIIGAKLIGAQQYINGLAAMENSEIEQNGTGYGPGDAATLYQRAWTIAQATLNTQLLIPAGLLPESGYQPQTVEFQNVSGQVWLNTQISSTSAQGLESAASSIITTQAVAGDVAAEYNLGGQDLVNVGGAAAITSLTSAQLQTVYNGLVTKAVTAKLLPANFATTTAVTYTGTPVVGMVVYTPATSTTGATVEIGSGVNSVAEAQTLIAHELGIAQNQTLETAASAAATQYGIDAAQTIAAINTLEISADQTGAALIGAQNYVNGLSAMENNELAAANSGTADYPADADTLFQRAQLIAEETPGTDLAIAPNLVPDNTAGDGPLTMEYTGTGSAETLDTATSSSQDTGLITQDQSTLAEDASSGDAADAELNGGGQDAQNAGANSMVTSKDQVQQLANALEMTGINVGQLIPGGFNAIINVINDPADVNGCGPGCEQNGTVTINLAYQLDASDTQFLLGHELTHTTQPQDGQENATIEGAADVGGVNLVATTNNTTISEAAQQAVDAIGDWYDSDPTGRMTTSPNNFDDPDHGGKEFDRSVNLVNNLALANPGQDITVAIPELMVPSQKTDENGNVVAANLFPDATPGGFTLNWAPVTVTAISVNGSPVQDTTDDSAYNGLIEEAAAPVYDPNAGLNGDDNSDAGDEYDDNTNGGNDSCGGNEGCY